MHDWQYFFDHAPHNLDEATYRIFEPEWKAEILHWFSREDVAKQHKEEFIKSLIDFEDGCGDVYQYQAYFLASEALAHFKDCSLGDAIVGQLFKYIATFISAGRHFLMCWVRQQEQHWKQRIEKG